MNLTDVLKSLVTPATPVPAVYDPYTYNYSGGRVPRMTPTGLPIGEKIPSSMLSLPDTSSDVPMVNFHPAHIPARNPGHDLTADMHVLSDDSPADTPMPKQTPPAKCSFCDTMARAIIGGAKPTPSTE